MLPNTDTDISVPGIGIGINTRYWSNPKSCRTRNSLPLWLVIFSYMEQWQRENQNGHQGQIIEDIHKQN